MVQKVIISFCIALYAIGVPLLELNDTHVFSSNWTPHARLHEVWQLIANSSLGFLSLWLLWFQDKVILSAVISLLITGSLLLACLLQDTYGGSIIYAGGGDSTVLGFNTGAMAAGLVTALLVVSLCMELLRSKES